MKEDKKWYERLSDEERIEELRKVYKKGIIVSGIAMALFLLILTYLTLTSCEKP